MYDDKSFESYIRHDKSLFAVRESLKAQGINVDSNDFLFAILINPDARVHMKILANEAVEIKSSTAINKIKKSLKIQDDSVYSRKLGSTIDADADVKEYSCECGALYSRYDKGTICDECNTVVEKTYNTKLDVIGYVDIAPYKVISHVPYMILETLIGPTNLRNIILKENEVNIHGRYDKDMAQKIVKKGKSNSPYMNMGLIGLYDNFTEIVNYYGRVNKRQEIADFVLKFKNRFWMSKIPFIPLELRPLYISKNKKTSAIHDIINEHYITLVSDAENIRKTKNNPSKINVYNDLHGIQTSVNKLTKVLLNVKMAGKYAAVRSKFLSGECNYSSRMVANSLTGRHFGLSNIVIPYKSFLELYHLELINLLYLGYGGPAFMGKTLNELSHILDLRKISHVVDNDIYNMIQYFVNQHKDGLWALLNRNPTMKMFSFQCMRIAYVTKSASSKVIKVPDTSNTETNADHDGDVLSTHKMVSKDVTLECIKGFAPHYAVLDRSGERLFNSNFGIYKDAKISTHVITCDNWEPI